PTDLAAGAGGLWVLGGAALAESQSGGPVATALARVDPTTRTVRARIVLPRTGTAVTELTEDHVAVERDAVWAIASDYSVVRIDPRTNRIVATIRGLQARAVAAGAGVWVLGIDGTIARIDRRTNRIAVRDRIGASAVASLTAGGGAAWVSAPGDGTVWRVDPGPRLVMRTIDVGAGAGDLSFGAGSVWVANPLRGTLARIDPATNRVTRTLQLGGTPRAVAAAADGVWVTVAGDRRSAAADADARAAGAPVHGSCEPTFFGGGGRPDRLIVSDLPLQGGVRISAQQMVQAAAFVLRQRGFRAGDVRVGLQSCDDSLARSGLFEPAKCAANARAYARDERVVAVMGTLNSPCTAAALPELARALGGPLAMLSPLNSSVSLTRRQAGAPTGELRSFYPGGRRHFARVFPTDDHQAVALASLAVEDLDAQRVAALDDGDLLFGRALADRFATAARSLGGEVVARRSWNPETGSYDRLARAIARARPDAVFLGGILDSNGAAVLRAIRRAVGPEVAIMASEGFTGTELLAKQAGAAADGTYVSVNGLINASLPRAGRRFVDAFAATLPGVDIEPSAVYAAEATGVLLDALAASDGTRAGVLSALFRTDLRGLTGRIRFDRNGDVVAAPITILQIRRGSRRLHVYPDAVVARVLRTRSPAPG
ncbi:MAG TPA: ABC transporter substrate-binding protein, partial [Solirubrobacteraceae bacterium]|nr:ABC transporter substrate-binding protein [Solirubrobacteraceae bacterium]